MFPRNLLFNINGKVPLGLNAVVNTVLLRRPVQHQEGSLK